jgi:hypothetical protein
MDPQYLAQLKNMSLEEQIRKLEADLLFLRDRVALYDLEQGWSSAHERDLTVESISELERYLDQLH